MFGKYASARDAGNFAAGMVAQQSMLPNAFFDYGYGLYNMSGNNFATSALLLFSDLMLLHRYPYIGASVMLRRARFGEHPLSRMGIEAGKNFFR